MTLRWGKGEVARSRLAKARLMVLPYDEKRAVLARMGTRVEVWRDGQETRWELKIAPPQAQEHVLAGGIVDRGERRPPLDAIVSGTTTARDKESRFLHQL